MASMRSSAVASQLMRTVADMILYSVKMACGQSANTKQGDDKGIQDEYRQGANTKQGENMGGQDGLRAERKGG